MTKTKFHIVSAAIAASASICAAASANPSALDRRWVHLQCDLSKDAGFDKATNIVSIAAAHGYTGVMFASSSKLTTLHLWDDASKARLARVKSLCDAKGLETGAVLWACGYPKDSFFLIDPNLSSANPVFGTRYRVEKGRCVHMAPAPRELVASRVQIHAPRRDGDFKSIDVPVTPRRSYRLTLKATAEGGGSSWPIALAVRHPGTSGDWIEHRVHWVKTDGKERSYTLEFPSMGLDKVTVCCFEYNQNLPGHVEMASLSLEERPPIVAVRRHGTPITVRNAKTGEAFEEGVDFAPIPRAKDVWPGDWIPAERRFAVKPLPGGRMKEGEEIVVDCYAPFPVWGKWQGACMAAQEMDSILQSSVSAVQKAIAPSVWLLGLDEVRTGGGCEDCRAIGDMAHVYAAFVKKCMAAVRKRSPKAEVYLWNDMVDPYCMPDKSGEGRYAALYSGMKGVWDLLPRDLGIACWRIDSREKGLPFFAERGHSIMIGAYYDANNLDSSVEWAKIALDTPGVKGGIMYCTWCNKWDLLGAFGDEMKRIATEAKSGDKR